MIAVPALDLRDGHCVQLVGGDYAHEALRLDAPLLVAQRWASLGFTRLHLVDLDAATGRGDNRDLAREIITQSSVPVQMGGGLRSADAIDDRLAAGADRVVVGTRGIEDPQWLAVQAARLPGRIVLAADVREREIVTRGWAERSNREILGFIREISTLPLAGLLVTAVQYEGRMGGTDLPLMSDVSAVAPWPVLASGGIGSMQDLRDLVGCGVAAVVLGLALYTGALDARAVAEEFGE